MPDLFQRRSASHPSVSNWYKHDTHKGGSVSRIIPQPQESPATATAYPSTWRALKNGHSENHAKFHEPNLSSKNYTIITHDGAFSNNSLTQRR